MLCALIMAGGKGTRFWPLSTADKPKQFLKLLGSETMIQMTVNRITPIIPIERVFVCTGEMYVDLVKEQLESKLYTMPDEIRFKIQKTLQKIINEGSNNIITIIL